MELVFRALAVFVLHSDPREVYPVALAAMGLWCLGAFFYVSLLEPPRPRKFFGVSPRRARW